MQVILFQNQMGAKWEADFEIMNMMLLKIPPDVIGLDKKYRDAIR